MKLGEILIQQGLTDQDTINKALRIQVGSDRRLGDILVKMKVISADKLAEILSEQMDTPICEIKDHFSNEVQKLIPRYLCRNYDVIPLKLTENNTLELAMANPSDHEVRRNIENYTGKVVVPRLAKLSSIHKEIPQRISITAKDIFSPRVNIGLTRIGVVTCLLLLACLGYFTYNYIHTAKYGSQSTTSNSTIYKNHDLMVGVDKNGLINFFGHGAYANGYYSVKFSSVANLRRFIDNKRTDLSEKQIDWLEWVIAQEQNHIPAKALAKVD